MSEPELLAKCTDLENQLRGLKVASGSTVGRLPVFLMFKYKTRNT